METTDLRIALFSGNYNYVRDGANQALNRLVGYLLRQGAKVRVYAPTTDTPAFEPTGDLVSLPSVPIPGRPEYRLSSGINARIRKDLAAFAPNIVHVSAPDVSGHRAVSWARKHGLPVLASVHTRFETYPAYYNMGFLEPPIEAMLRRFYNRCDALLAPSEDFVTDLRDKRMNRDIGIWARGVDRSIFNSSRRDPAWRKRMGIGDDEVAVGFHSRLVMEKGLEVFADTIDALAHEGIKPRVVIIGEGPARGWLEERLPGITLPGFKAGTDLATAVASMDVMFFASTTEGFSNVVLEAMACGLPVVAADATGISNLVEDGVTGALIEPGSVAGFAAALKRYLCDADLRARHGAAGEKRSEDYSWDQINKAVTDAYKRLIAARPALT